MRRALAVGALVALTGCTDRQVAQWVEWFQKEPEAAIAFANQPEIQQALAGRESGTSTTSGGWSTDWDRISQCESGGRWDYPPVTNRTGTYTGGLMIWTRAWDAYGGEEFASDAYLATKAQQIVVAERIWSDRGARAWDCK